MGDNKKVHIIGGGTVFHVRPHLALTAPAYGTTARKLADICRDVFPKMDIELHLTRMAGGSKNLETNDDVAGLIASLVKDDTTKIIFMNAAMCDFDGSVPLTHNDIIGDARAHLEGRPVTRVVGKRASRLKTGEGNNLMFLMPAPKVINKIRKERKDIFLVGFKTTSGASEDEQYLAGLTLCKGASCNLVLANDIQTRTNMIITPEEARYCVTKNRDEALQELVKMAWLRSHLTFTRSTVVSGNAVAWTDERVPQSLRTVVDFCRERGAYKPFRGATAGHFAVKLDNQTFLTSIRKTDFNMLPKLGLVLVKTDGPDSVIAYGAKPSVGGQSQRIVFREHPKYDCIVHFHCPIKEGSKVPTVSQREFECGSHECGKNTSTGLKDFTLTDSTGSDVISAVYLDQHGPNIVFHHSTNPQKVIKFIEENFDLEQKTGGFVSVAKEQA